MNAFPYGEFYAKACNTADTIDPPSVEPVANRFGCQSTCAFRGVFDLSGNVREWEDSCYSVDGGSDYCLVRGGAYSATQDGSSCLLGTEGAVPAWVDGSVGFRCCGP